MSSSSANGSSMPVNSSASSVATGGDVASWVQSLFGSCAGKRKPKQSTDGHDRLPPPPYSEGRDTAAVELSGLRPLGPKGNPTTTMSADTRASFAPSFDKWSEAWRAHYDKDAEVDALLGTASVTQYGLLSKYTLKLHAANKQFSQALSGISNGTTTFDDVASMISAPETEFGQKQMERQRQDLRALWKDANLGK